MRKISHIVIHCADTPEGVYFDIKDIRKWHVQERGWRDVGYHYIVLLDGTIQLGRDLKTIGAGVSGYNKNTIHICYIGGKHGRDTRTIQQKATLVYLVATLKRTFRKSEAWGHRDFPGVRKFCPSFDAIIEYKNI